MDKIYSVIALRKSVFLSHNVLPYNRGCEKEDLVNSSNLESLLLKVLRRCIVYHVQQWRRKSEVDLISKPQPQLDLNNLENYA